VPHRKVRPRARQWLDLRVCSLPRRKFAASWSMLINFASCFPMVSLVQAVFFAIQSAQNLPYTANSARDFPGYDGLLANIYGSTS
jgi:hypothetical protein